MKGLRKYLTPFAPDQSGAVGVLYELGGIVVIVDAGGCAGNICGFDEPRWQTQKSAVFSAGLRDMDAILGRDDRLVSKLAHAAEKLEARFAAVVGTPVPAVIGTDYRALKRMAEKKTGLPVLAIDTNGMEWFDVGEEKAYLALFQTFARESLPVQPGKIGVLGCTPLSMSDLNAGTKLEAMLTAQGWDKVCCYGMGCGLEAIQAASSAEKNLVVSPSGLKAAEYLKKKFGTPYEAADPLAAELLGTLDVTGKTVLVTAQQVRGNALREELLRRGAKGVTVSTWFMKKKEWEQPGDVLLTEEDQYQELVEQGGFDVILGDSALFSMVKQWNGERLALPDFAVSGRLME